MSENMRKVFSLEIVLLIRKLDVFNLLSKNEVFHSSLTLEF